MLPADDQVFRTGSYNSADANPTNKPPLRAQPPATRTLPLVRIVAVWKVRPVDRLPAADQVLVEGLYSSAPAMMSGLPVPNPPVTSTLPVASRVAVWPYRAAAMLAAADQVLVTGSYSSADDSSPDWPPPPATSTLPLGSTVEVAKSRA